MSRISDKAYSMLSSAVRSGKAFHAFFISSTDSAEGLGLAYRVASECMGCDVDEQSEAEQTDLFRLHGEETGAKEIRSLIEELSKAAFDGGMRAIIISNAHRMTREAQNTLLKTLEEPPEGVFFLLCGNADGMLSTVISRCALIRLGQPTVYEAERLLSAHGANREDAHLFARICGGSGERAARLYEDTEFRSLRQKSLYGLIAAFNGEIIASAAKAIAKGGAADALTFMLSFMGDVLSINMGMLRETDNADMQTALEQCAARFTTRQILCIIDMITKASESLFKADGGDMYPAAVLDGLFLSILKECNK